MRYLVIFCICVVMFNLVRWFLEEIKGGDKKRCRDCSKVVICKTYNDILSSSGAEDEENYRVQLAPNHCRYIRKPWKFWRPE